MVPAWIFEWIAWDRVTLSQWRLPLDVVNSCRGLTDTYEHGPDPRRVAATIFRRGKMLIKLRIKLWNWWARHILKMETCHLCDDTTGDVIGNGHYHAEYPDILMCDGCSALYRRYGEFWTVHPPK